jgi:hypothetical protein
MFCKFWHGENRGAVGVQKITPQREDHVAAAGAFSQQQLFSDIGVSAKSAAL